MNVYQRLCTPFLEALCDDRAFDINIPGLVDDDLEGLLDLEADNDDEVDNNQVRKATKRFADGRTCRAYAQIMAVAAMILELKSGTVYFKAHPISHEVPIQRMR